MMSIETIEKIEELGNAGKYQEQGELFLTATETTLEIVEAVPQKTPIWAKDGKHGINYSVTLKNQHGQYTFDFWGSIADREKVANAYARGARNRVKEMVKPNAYNILTALHTMSEDNFEDFCSAFGYDTDSRLAEKTYNACMEQDNHMRRLFDRGELEALNSIA